MDLSKFKIGDKVRVTKRHSTNEARVGMVGTIIGIDLYCCQGIHFNVAITTESKGYFESWCEEVKHIEKPKPWGCSKIEFRFI